MLHENVILLYEILIGYDLYAWSVMCQHSCIIAEPYLYS